MEDIGRFLKLCFGYPFGGVDGHMVRQGYSPFRVRSGNGRRDRETGRNR